MEDIERQEREADRKVIIHSLADAAKGETRKKFNPRAIQGTRLVLRSLNCPPSRP